MAASFNIARMRGLAPTSAPRCAGPAMSRALFYPMPDRLALGAACSVQSSVNPGKSLSRDLLSNPIVDFSSSFLLQDCVAVHPEDVVDTANARASAQESEFRLRILAQLNTFVHCSDDVCFWPRVGPRKTDGVPQQLQVCCSQ